METLFPKRNEEQPMINRIFKSSQNETLKYTLLGALFGFLFPVFATSIEMAIQKLPFGVLNAVYVQRAEPLLWIIDTAPVFLGLFAALAGRHQDALVQMNVELSAREIQMKIAQETIEQQVDERTAALEQANQQISRRASQLQAITEVSEAIAQLQDLNRIFPSVVKLISQNFGFYHVGIFLVDQGREYAILQAANSEGGE